MDSANADSDHSMTWEDFFGSTTDLTPTLIGIYDSLLEPPKILKPDVSKFDVSAKDARNDPPQLKETNKMKNETKENDKQNKVLVSPKDITKVTSIKQPNLPIATVNKSSLYSLRTKIESDKSNVNEQCKFISSDSVRAKSESKVFDVPSQNAFDNLSPNVKRMISGASETTSTLKYQKKPFNNVRASGKIRSNIPLIGATSKIAQSRVEVSSNAGIYDQPCIIKSPTKSEEVSPEESPSKKLKPEFRIDAQETYDVPTNGRPVISAMPLVNKTAFESLSLPYIDQSLEHATSPNDREFDTKISSNESTPEKPDQNSSPFKQPEVPTIKSNSLNRNGSPKLNKNPYLQAISSTGNLKASDKDIRLNPASVDVSRPLSMSSIASSSSTSSSGVQNKGGVNSAYLASIESLDDHSDADVTSVNGSSGFVNSVGVVKSSVGLVDSTPREGDELSGLSQLERVCAEIIHTENVYVQDLQQVVEGYLQVWRREDIFSDEELAELFNNIEDIYRFNRSFCEELNSCRLDATCIAKCFVNNTTGFNIYTSYCTGYPCTMERLAALASKAESAREFRERQLALGHPLPLASYLLKPVQRILKYHLLLQNVVKQCASHETEFALLKMTGIAQHIDDMKRKHEHAVRVQEIQSLLYGWNGPDLTTYGELCAEGTFRVFGAKAMRHAFLFDKMLLITKNREDGILAYKSHIMCNNMMLVESIAGAPLSFHVIPWDAPRAQVTLLARSLTHKREWTLLLKRVILENYNAVIPSHAKQLVMELGQNRTDDDMLAEKSHNLITQASMRKQLSAPEYLEKRKLERERRKSFDTVNRRSKKIPRKHTIAIAQSTNNQTCDCVQVSIEKGVDYTCENCYIDLCSDCENGKEKSKDKCTCRQDDSDKCSECKRSTGNVNESAENLDRTCKCEFKSSQESFGNEFIGTLNKTRGYHSSDNIVSYTESKNKDDLSDTNNSLLSIQNVRKPCLKCSKKENRNDLVNTLRKSRYNNERQKDSSRSKSKEDGQRSKLSKIGTWRRKSEPGLQQNAIVHLTKKNQDDESELRGFEKIEFECRNCGTNKISKRNKTLTSDTEDRKRGKPAIEIRMYNAKNIPKKISKIKKNRAKGVRIGTDTTAKFYADFSSDVSTENILHITESNESINIEKEPLKQADPTSISKDEDIDDETYKKLIEKTDSFKKNELEKVKYLNKQNVINEGSELDEKEDVEMRKDVVESCEDTEQPLEHIISQLLLQNREFQKLLKKQQQRSSAQRRHQRLLKSHSNPEQPNTINNDTKLKLKHGRESFDSSIPIQECTAVNNLISTIENHDASDDDHIYETLRVVKKVDENLHTLNNKTSSIQDNTKPSKPKRQPSPPNPTIDITSDLIHESDYVYLSFNKLNDTEGVYDVPVKSPVKVQERPKTDYYVIMENGSKPHNIEEVYDSIVDVCRRKKDNTEGDYLPMRVESPNTPEIWLSRQKEHFNVSRDRKSGSLPRSFQVVTGQEEENLSSFKNKPNNNKTYLNKDGKVVNTERPFTIASDQSELSYDDVENYINDGDIMKFITKGENISQSTLELEEEIDRCYKNKFEGVKLGTKSENQLDVSNQNLNVSTSSCEVISDKNDLENQDDIQVIHPEHKIYKPTSSMLSLKNVLNRFKNRNLNKSQDEPDTNTNSQSSPESVKSDPKSPTTEKRSALNPRSYSKNLLQRFKNIIGDEQTDDNTPNKSDLKNKKVTEEVQNALMTKTEVVVSTEANSPVTTNLKDTINVDSLSKSVCENKTLNKSQNEKSDLDALSHSCDNINRNLNSRPIYDKSVSMVTNKSFSSITSSKSNNNSYQNLNKLPVYMQGSKLLGARIALSEYADPTSLLSEKTAIKSANVLINKNAVRPDSLFSNSSFITSSSEGTYQESQSKNVNENNESTKKVSALHKENEIKTESTLSDESYYEKSFEKIEHLVDVDVFRDSAVYSDQEDGIEGLQKVLTKQVSRVETLKRNLSIKEKSTNTVKTESSISVSVTTSKTYSNDKNVNTEEINTTNEKCKFNVAPPIPVKPKLTNIPTTTSFLAKNISNRKLSTKSDQTDSTIVKRNTLKAISSKTDNVNDKKEVITKQVENKFKDTDVEVKKDKIQRLKPTSNIQMKRLSFERASLDSASRKKTITETKRTSVDGQNHKSVLERRMEIESLTKSQKLSQTAKKPSQLMTPKSLTPKVAPFERSVSDIAKKEVNKTFAIDSSTNNEIELQNTEIEDSKSSWVKTVVNKFQ